MKVFYLIAVTILLASCSGYNSIVKSDDYEKKFTEANRLYDKKQFTRSVALYEQVYQRSPRTSQGELSYYRLGKAYYELEDWYLANYYLGAFSGKFPFSAKCEETTFLAALCSVQNSPESSLDQHETDLALNDLQLFVSLYPNSKFIDTCNTIMDQLRLKIETKDAQSVRLYAKTENYRAATVSAERFLENYPISVYREEISAIMLRNSYLLTLNSIESKLLERIEKTRERYRNFVAEFPKSTYLREFDNYTEKLDALQVAQETKPENTKK